MDSLRKSDLVRNGIQDRPKGFSANPRKWGESAPVLYLRRKICGWIFQPVTARVALPGNARPG